MPAVSHHAALIYVMVVVSASDGSMSENELHTIGDLAKHLPVFRGFDERRLVQVSQECAEILAEADGLNAVLGLIRESLPRHLRETAYWLALEVALSDFRLTAEEARMLELLQRALELDDLVVHALARGARAKHLTG